MTLSKILSRAFIVVVVLSAGIGFSQTTQPANSFASQTNYNFEHVTPEMAAFGSRGIHVHDPSTIVKCKDEYWVFYTGRGVPSFHSKDLITWQAGPPVFTNVPA